MNSALGKDLRYAWRMLLKSPGFTAVAILTLALGIGANSAIFAVANSVLLRPLPYREPGRLVLISSSNTDGRTSQVFSYPRYQQFSGQGHSFSSMAAFANETFDLTGRAEPEEIPSARVSWNFFDVLGVGPEIGRAFLPEEDRPEGNRAAVISHRMWLRNFAGDPGAVGQTMTLNSEDYTIVGVLPAGFALAVLGQNVDIYVPKVFNLNAVTPAAVQGGTGFLNAVARLNASVTLAQAQAEMEVLNTQYMRDNPTKPDADPKRRIVVEDLQRASVANLRPALLVLVGAVACVLLIACANVASLLLSRALARKKEIAVRTALGAKRGAIVRQLLTESVLLALAGGVVGIFAADGGTRILSTLATENLPQLSAVHLDFRAVLFTAGISILSGVLFGLMPALQISRPDVNAALREEGRGSTGSRRRANARNILVVAQVALSMALLVGAGLLIRSFAKLQLASPGFDPKNVLTMKITLPPSHYSARPQMISFYNEALRRAATVPGVEAAAISSALPLTPARITPILVEGQPELPLAQRPFLNIQTISPDYARVMRLPLVTGREFKEQDDAQAAPVAIVNQAFARRFWPNENPIGKRLWLGRQTNSTEVVGVFGDIKNTGIMAAPAAEVFLPFPQLPWAMLHLNVRSSVAPQSLTSALRAQISGMDKDQPITEVQTLEELLGAAKAQPRFTTFLLGVFSATALILAIVGIYGVIAYSVAQRTQEMGIRVALGATRGDILRLVIRYGLGLAGAGILGGLVLALGVTRVMASLLYQISATDPLTFAGSAAVFLLVAAAASYVPALRATHVDPVITLRYE